MPLLITLETAKAHLRITTATTSPMSAADEEIELKAEQASDIVIAHLNAPDDVWTDATVPKPIQAAILLALGELYEHRGDDMTLSEKTWAAIARVLVPWRTGALA